MDLSYWVLLILIKSTTVNDSFLPQYFRNTENKLFYYVLFGLNSTFEFIHSHFFRPFCRCFCLSSLPFNIRYLRNIAFISETQTKTHSSVNLDQWFFGVHDEISSFKWNLSLLTNRQKLVIVLILWIWRDEKKPNKTTPLFSGLL
jgi:hypothetical protein